LQRVDPSLVQGFDFFVEVRLQLVFDSFQLLQRFEVVFEFGGRHLLVDAVLHALQQHARWRRSRFSCSWRWSWSWSFGCCCFG